MYDLAGRIERITSSNGGYTRWVYPSAQTSVQNFSLLVAGAQEFYTTQLLDGAGRVRATARDFPGSTGRYSGQYIEYDNMGRAMRQSNPTEINNLWFPAGDDAAGWLYTRQQYDWQGRPTITTNTDQTTAQVSYGGCGCAGGEVVTERDEVGRQGRMTYDVLGRLLKTEVLNWNSTVYKTITNTYNARDQITNIKDQQGTSGAFQQTVMTYDGHGRRATRKAPVESGPTLYEYNKDDTLKKATDPRGASAAYTYNNRRLVTNITYAKPGNAPEIEGPAGIPLTPAVGFGYDTAGNRLWMTDGLGRIDYVYDTWSRLTSETRQFTGVGSFQLTYTYNLAGGLTSLTDPFGARVNYSHNQAGQVTTVTATGYPGVTQFASGMAYRAWGGLKRITYGNNRTLDLSYNGRLLMTRFDLFGFTGSEYQYNADGRVSYVKSLNNSQYDRAYSYDHAGRMTEGMSGRAARGLPPDPDDEDPYRQSYQYDAWNNLTYRANRIWNFELNPYSATFVNDRNPQWQYDEAGNILDDQIKHKYDTANRQVKSWDSVTFTIDQDYDGDGQPAKRVEVRSSFTSTVYYVRSSVLGGEVVTELKGNGHEKRSCVYVNGEEIARYDKAANQVFYTVRNPVTGAKEESLTNGTTWKGEQTDPLGGYTGFSDPFIENPETTYESLHEEEPLYLEDADPFNGGSGCTLEGVMEDRFGGVAQIVNQAVTIIHELGHAANFLYGHIYPNGAASQIDQRDSDGTTGGSN